MEPKGNYPMVGQDPARINRSTEETRRSNSMLIYLVTEGVAGIGDPNTPTAAIGKFNMIKSCTCSINPCQEKDN